MSIKRNILFICQGNSCRSPMAEAAFRDIVAKQGLQDKYFVDSAGVIDLNVGRRPFRFAREVLEREGLPATHVGRQICDEDFRKFDIIFGMDEENMEDLEEMRPAGPIKASMRLLGEYDPDGQIIIPDPYWNQNPQEFSDVYHKCIKCINAFLEQDAKQH